MHTKFELIIFFLGFSILSIFLFSAEKGAVPGEKKEVTTIYMDPANDTLRITDQLDQSAGNKTDRIIFNNKDYTKFATELLEKYPMAYTSCNLLIFGKEKVEIMEDELKCRQGILFIPGDDEISIIRVSGITYNENTKIVRGTDARWKKIKLTGEKTEEKELKKLTLKI